MIFSKIRDRDFEKCGNGIPHKIKNVQKNWDCGSGNGNDMINALMIEYFAAFDKINYLPAQQLFFTFARFCEHFVNL